MISADFVYHSGNKVRPLSQRRSALENGRKQPCQSQKFTNAAAAHADAVRVRSSSLTRGRNATHIMRFSFHLTPARVNSRQDDGLCPPEYGLGGMVPVGTILEPLRNQQLIEIIGFFLAVPWFCACPSRDVRAYAYAPAHTCRRLVEAGTTEPQQYILYFQWFIGSTAVLEWFWLEPVNRLSSTNGGFLGFLIKIMGGYCDQAAIGPLCILLRWGAAKKFGLFCGAGRAWAGWIDRLGGIGRNGGFLRFFDRLSGAVGMDQLEGSRENGANAWFFEDCRKLVRLPLIPIAADLGGDQRGRGWPPIFAAAIISHAPAPDFIKIRSQFRRHSIAAFPIGKNGATFNRPIGVGGRVFPLLILKFYGFLRGNSQPAQTLWSLLGARSYVNC